MTLDEALKHTKDKVKELGNCKCGEDHKQLMEWLIELKELKSE